MQNVPKVGSLMTWPLLVRLVSLKWAGEPCELVARPGTPSSRNTGSCWQEQETPTVWPLLPIWDDPFFYQLKFSRYISHYQHRIPAAPVIWWVLHGNSLYFQLSPQGSPWTPFWLKGGKRRPPLLTCVPPTNRPSWWLSCCGQEAVLSHLLWDILPISSTSHYTFKKDPSYIRVHDIWMLPILVFQGIH